MLIQYSKESNMYEGASSVSFQTVSDALACSILVTWLLPGKLVNGIERGKLVLEIPFLKKDLGFSTKFPAARDSTSIHAGISERHVCHLRSYGKCIPCHKVPGDAGIFWCIPEACRK